jgi:hypothetical protein
MEKDCGRGDFLDLIVVKKNQSPLIPLLQGGVRSMQNSKKMNT